MFAPARARQWLAQHPRWMFHFIPTSASWLNAVEGFFAKLTRQRLKRGVFRSVIDLQVPINRFVAETNVDPKPFVWTADPIRVIAAVKRGKQTLESVHWCVVCGQIMDKWDSTKVPIFKLIHRPEDYQSPSANAVASSSSEMMWERRGGFGRSFSFHSVPSLRARRTKNRPRWDRGPHVSAGHLTLNMIRRVVQGQCEHWSCQVFQHFGQTSRIVQI